MPFKPSPVRSLLNYALTGAAASFTLTLVEWIDINVQLTPVFRTSTERLILTAYLGLNLVVGASMGLLVGLFALVGGSIITALAELLSNQKTPRTRDRLVALLLVGLVAAYLLSLQPQIHSYTSGLTIEAQKLPYIYGKLLRFERFLVPLIVFGLLIACWLTWLISRLAIKFPVVRWIRLLVIMIAVVTAYYIDSRDQVQLYEFTLHRSMFLLAQGAAMAFFASLYSSSPRIRNAVNSNTWRAIAVHSSVTLLVAASVAFTFIHFGRNQNLKVQLFTRTTQAKQHFKLAQWVLDFDRDGYSESLAGGDADDRRADVSPAQKEILEDGIDNNQIGGDLTTAHIEDWFRERSAVIARPITPSRELNIIYVFIDAARADHFGIYNYNRGTTPNIDRLASKSVVFDNAFSPAANTFESAARFMKSSYWDAPVETWTEALTRSGYDTILFPERRLPMLDRYVKGARVAPGSEGKFLKETIDVAVDMLSKPPTGRPFCAFIYAVEPHMPYAPHKQFDFGSSLADLYDGELAFTDHHLGRLFDWLEKSNRMDDTMIVVMADHGESLGERGVYRHSSQLYNEQTRVPMIIYAPNVAARRVSDYVTTIDLGSTILDLAGVPRPEKYTGVSLAPLMRGESFIHPPIFAEQTLREKEFPNLRPDQYPQAELKKYMIVTTEGYKLIYNREYQTFELFNLKSDPGELNNLYDYLPSVALNLKYELGRFVDIVTALRPENADERKYRVGNDRDSSD
jgi:arylsulfatase A-like enzyme